MPYTRYDQKGLPYVTFDGVYAYAAYGMILKSSDVGVPEKKRTKISLPLCDGDIDITSAISSVDFYKNRKIQLIFTVQEKLTAEERGALRKKIVTALNGRRFERIYVSDVDSVFSGYVTVNKFQTNWKEMIIVLTVDADPKSSQVVPKKTWTDLAPSTQDPEVTTRNSMTLTIPSGTLIAGAAVYARCEASTTRYVKADGVTGDAATKAIGKDWTKLGVVRDDFTNQLTFSRLKSTPATTKDTLHLALEIWGYS